MLAELHWLGIAVTREMTDPKNIHSPELLVANREITVTCKNSPDKS
jgi:hypothetical protein